MEPYASSSSTENAEPATETEQEPEVKPKKITKRARQDCGVSESTSHTMFLKKERYEDLYSRITRDEYFGKEESLSASSDSFHCIHGPEGKSYTEQGRLKRNITKNLDRVPLDRKWNDDCPPAYEWDVANKLVFLIMDSADLQLERMDAHLRDFARTTREGFRIDVLDTTCVILDFLVETYEKEPSLREGLVMMLNNMAKPILLNLFNDIITYFESLRNYLGFMGYLLLRLEPDELFDMVAKALLWQLSAPDEVRGPGAASRRRSLLAAATPLYQTVARMLALATPHRFPIFLQLAILLACDSSNNCIELLKENIFENMMYRFNPYFPERALLAFDINPADPQDYRVKLGDSGVHLSTMLTLFLVLLTNLKKFTEEDPEFTHTLPCPDSYALRCFTWAYRYECRAREHKQERITLTVVAWVLVKCFGRRLQAFSTLLMPDVMSLSVLTELPHKTGWIKDVGFNISLIDVQFKKILIYFCIDLLKTFPYNKHMAESQYWVLGLMYLLDPALSSLRVRWASPLVAELRKASLQALVCSLPLLPPHVAKDYSLIRRILWYIEWYSESPYELPVLYWCVRLMQVACQRRRSPERPDIIADLFDTHGIIILMQLCLTLMKQEQPPVEKRQAIIALSLRMLTSALEAHAEASCCVYPAVKWPRSINSLADKMLDNILKSLHTNYIISDRWMISLLNFIWEAIIWKESNRKNFISQNGVYRLLDLITMVRPPVQCLALALVCDITRAGDAVGQLVTWRACAGASEANPMVVKRGSTIASLLASVFRDGCRENGIELDANDIIQDMDTPLRAADIKKAMSSRGFAIGCHTQTPVCYAASDLAGSRMSKAFALLQLLSEDLNFKVNIADEAYKLYKHIKLEAQDEAILVLCSHYLTQKLNEAWCEIEIQYPDVEPLDKYTIEEFRHISKGWAVEIKRQQVAVLEKDFKKKHDEECSLYAFLGRVRLNTALDALREVRCTARSADRARLTHALLSDAVSAHHQRAAHAQWLGAPVLRTYGPSLDDQGDSEYIIDYHNDYCLDPGLLALPLLFDESSTI